MSGKNTKLTADAALASAPTNETFDGEAFSAMTGGRDIYTLLQEAHPTNDTLLKVADAVVSDIASGSMFGEQVAPVPETAAAFRLLADVIDDIWRGKYRG